MVRKILILDDEVILLKTFTRLLEKFDYETYALTTGEQALLLAGAELFDLVICDVMMPGMPGLEALRRLRDLCLEKYGQMPPVILMTGFKDEALEKKMKAAKPADVLWKPFGAFDLLHCVNKILKAPLGVAADSIHQ